MIETCWMSNSFFEKIIFFFLFSFILWNFSFRCQKYFIAKTSLSELSVHTFFSNFSFDSRNFFVPNFFSLLFFLLSETTFFGKSLFFSISFKWEKSRPIIDLSFPHDKLYKKSLVIPLNSHSKHFLWRPQQNLLTWDNEGKSKMPPLWSLVLHNEIFFTFLQFF